MGIFCLSFVVQGTAQNIHALKVEDELPSIKLFNVLNYKTNAISLSDYKDKVLIIDFFATWCAPCVRGLSKLQELQNLYKGKIQVFVVTSESLETIKAFLKKATPGSINMPFITEDSIMKAYFPHKAIPHEVIIDKNLRVRAITSMEYINDINISRLLLDKKTDWGEKNDFPLFDVSKPIFEQRSTAETSGVNFLRYSGFTGNIKDLSPGLNFVRDSSKQVIRYNQYNNSIIELYNLAFDRFPSFLDPQRCSLVVADKSRYFYDPSSGLYKRQWEQLNTYSYEAVHPITASDKEIKKKLKDDLDFFFGLESKIVKERRQCLVLKDETGLKAPVDLNLDLGTHYKDLDTWTKALKRYGFDLVVEERELEILILIEIKMMPGNG